MAVVVYYVDKDYKSQTKLLTLRRLVGNHSKKNQTNLFTDVFKNYEIVEKIEYFISDNAINNDTTVDHLFRTILPSLTVQQRAQRRLRY